MTIPTETRYRTVVLAPTPMRDFVCLAETCPINCCSGWIIPIDTSHADFFQNLPDESFRKKMNGFLRSARVTRAGKQTTEHYFSLKTESDEKCRFLNATGRCQIQETYGEPAIADTCALFPRRIFQIDSSFTMTASLACPAVFDLLIAPSKTLTFSRFEAPTDFHPDWLDTDQIPDISLREILKQRDDYVLNAVHILTAPDTPFVQRLNLIANPHYWLCEISTLPNKPCDLEQPIRAIPPTALELGAELLDFENDLVLPNPSEIQIRVCTDMRDLMVHNKDAARILGENYLKTDREIVMPFLAVHPHLLRNYIVLMLFSDLLTEFNTYLRPGITAEFVRDTSIRRIILFINLLVLRLNAIAMRTGTLTISQFANILHENDKHFFQSPATVEGLIAHQRRRYSEKNNRTGNVASPVRESKRYPFLFSHLFYQ